MHKHKRSRDGDPNGGVSQAPAPAPLPNQSPVFNILSFGARANGVSDDSKVWKHLCRKKKLKKEDA